MDMVDLEDFMKLSTELDAAARDGIALRPSLETIAFYLRARRSINGWKQQTLASLAGVSLSTVERAERGEPVSDLMLERLALAMGQPTGSFTEPRIPLSAKESFRRMAETASAFDDKIWIPVRPIQGQRQIADLAKSHLYLPDTSRLAGTDPDVVDDVREYLDLIGFVISSEEDPIFNNRGRPPAKRRYLYQSALVAVRNAERASRSVILAGSYEADIDDPLMPKIKVAVLCFFPKATDPAAINRRYLAIPKRLELTWPGEWCGHA